MRREEIRRLLPAVFQTAAAEGTPIAALLGLMEQLHEPSEKRLAALDEVLDPRRAPERFVPFLAGWLDLPPELALGMDRLRALVALAADLARWRGTARGLTAFLEAATGATGFRIDDALRPFHLHVIAPQSLRPWRDG